MRQVQFADNTGGNSMAVQQRTVLLKGQTFVGMTDRMAEVQCLTDAVLTVSSPELTPISVRFRYTLAVLFVSALYPIWGWKKRRK